jgi:phosphatidylinositol alpha-1,6-mannosyltransferase
LKKKLGYKLAALHWENIPFARDHKRFCKFVKYRVYENVDGFFAMSERAKASLILEGVDESKVFVTGYGVDTNRFKPDKEAGQTWRKRFGISDDEFVILFVGRVRASKGIFELIYATKRLVTDAELNDKQIRVVIAGTGPRDEEVAKMARQLRLGKNLLQIGFIPHSEIHNVHNMADIFCLPSLPRKYWQEQLGLVFLEAMACGKPIVSTLSGSIPEVVDGAGILVQPNDHLALSEGLKKLINSPVLRANLGKLGHSNVLNKFTLDKIASVTIANYKTMLSQNDL